MENSDMITGTASESCDKKIVEKSACYKPTSTALDKFDEPKLCTFFSKYAHCRYGNDCKYQHFQQSSGQSFRGQKYTNGNKTFQDRVFRSNSNPAARNRNTSFLNKIYPKSNTICRYFKAGNCDKGDFCSYKHIVHSKEHFISSTNSPVNNTIKKSRVPICHYFKKGTCHRGESCKFYHSSKQIVPEGDEKLTAVEGYGKNNETPSNNDCAKGEPNFETHSIKNLHPVNQSEADVAVHKEQIFNRSIKPLTGNKLFDLSNISPDELASLRTTEIDQLKKRYPKHTETGQKAIVFTFEPSDPDWPFDLRSLDLVVHFPDKYPTEPCEISVMFLASNIPEILIRHLNLNIKEWIEQRFEELNQSMQAELMFRPFLKWFDKNLEDLFISGLRKVKRDIEAKHDGIEFVPPEKLFPENSGTGDLKSTTNNSSIENTEHEPEPHINENINNNQATNVAKNTSLLDSSALKQGIKILFNGLELIEGIATLSCSKLSLTVQCIRCKTSCNIKCLSGKNSSTKCSKCSKVIECNYCPSMMHQFSNNAGNLHVVECQIVDLNLVESVFLMDCLNCTKQISIDGLHYGQKQKRWCTSCNDKLIFSIENVKFQAMSSTYVASKNAPAKKVEKKKDPLFKEGLPLPDYGACKHYKKSYRWLRFPCCGRLYPCDVCHDEKENDHEMKFASRMICGFCSKEQPYSKEKPCTSCSGSMTSKSGTHWEGGKGCRNKIKMARDDKHKYVGTSKTVSKKAQSSKGAKK